MQRGSLGKTCAPPLINQASRKQPAGGFTPGSLTSLNNRVAGILFPTSSITCKHLATALISLNNRVVGILFLKLNRLHDR